MPIDFRSFLHVRALCVLGVRTYSIVCCFVQFASIYLSEFILYECTVHILFRLWAFSIWHKPYSWCDTSNFGLWCKRFQLWYEYFSFWNISSISHDLFVMRWECKSKYRSHCKELTLFHNLVKGLQDMLCYLQWSVVFLWLSYFFTFMFIGFKI